MIYCKKSDLSALSLKVFHCALSGVRQVRHTRTRGGICIPVTVCDRHVEYLKEEPRKAAPQLVLAVREYLRILSGLSA
jgi:hypothetical protein